MSVVLLLLLPMLQPETARAEMPVRYKIEMAYLYNFAKFVEWPDSVFADTSSPIVIGIVGEDPFGEALDQAIARRQAQGRSLEVRRFKGIEDLARTHVLYVSPSERQRQTAIIAALADSNVVTVGGTEDFTRDGGVVRFFFAADQTIKIEVNREAAERAGVFFSSRIMKIASQYREKRLRSGESGQ